MKELPTATSIPCTKTCSENENSRRLRLRRQEGRGIRARCCGRPSPLAAEKAETLPQQSEVGRASEIGRQAAGGAGVFAAADLRSRSADARCRRTADIQRISRHLFGWQRRRLTAIRCGVAGRLWRASRRLPRRLSAAARRDGAGRTRRCCRRHSKYRRRGSDKAGRRRRRRCTSRRDGPRTCRPQRSRPVRRKVSFASASRGSSTPAAPNRFLEIQWWLHSAHRPPLDTVSDPSPKFSTPTASCPALFAQASLPALPTDLLFGSSSAVRPPRLSRRCPSGSCPHDERLSPSAFFLATCLSPNRRVGHIGLPSVCGSLERKRREKRREAQFFAMGGARRKRNRQASRRFIIFPRTGAHTIVGSSLMAPPCRIKTKEAVPAPPVKT